jgi:hypothetical protein
MFGSRLRCRIVSELVPAASWSGAGEGASTTSFVKPDAEPRWVTLAKRRSIGVMVAALVIAMAVFAVAVLLILRELVDSS